MAPLHDTRQGRDLRWQERLPHELVPGVAEGAGVGRREAKNGTRAHQRHGLLTARLGETGVALARPGDRHSRLLE